VQPASICILAFQLSQVEVEVADNNEFVVVACILFVVGVDILEVAADINVEGVGIFVEGVGMLCNWNRTFVYFLFHFVLYKVQILFIDKI
jgi:hypothetical protein